MTIKIHPRFRTEAEAYRAASDALADAYRAPSADTWHEAANRETAIQIARLTHWQAAREYLTPSQADVEVSP